METTLLKTVICGSYRKHWDEVLRVRSFLEEQGVHVLAPTGFRVVNPGATFARLEGEPEVEVRMVQDAFFAQIRNATFLTVANVDGYLGKAVTFEIGYAIRI